MQILYADKYIAVVNKPSGLLSVPGKGPDKQDCVVSRIQKEFPLCIEFPAPHRLDMVTSGLMVLGLKKQSVKQLFEQFRTRKVKKTYIALLDGIIEEQSGTISLAIRLDVENRPIQIYDPIEGKEATTRWEKIREEAGKTRVRFYPYTGRTHQLRVHASHKLGLNCPIVGDKFYGNGKEGDRLCLHATKLTFSHPHTQEKMQFITEPLF